MNATTNSERRFWREFFDLYRSLPETWDTRNPGYQNRELKSYGYRRLLIKLTEMKPTAEIEDLRNTIYTIRKEYQRQIRKLEYSKSFVPTLWCFDEIAFLENAVQVDDLQPEDFYSIEEIFIDDDEGFSPQKMEPFEDFIQENDECSALGNSWAALYRKLSPDQQIYASRTISEVLCQGQLGCLNSLSHKLFEWKPQSIQSENKNPFTPSYRYPSPAKDENNLNEDFDFNSLPADENADEDNGEDDDHDEKPVNGFDEYPVKYIVVDESEEMHSAMKYAAVEDCTVTDDNKCDDEISAIIEENTSFDDLIQTINASESMETIENTNEDVGSSKDDTQFDKEKNISFEDLIQTINGSESMETVENTNDDAESDKNIDKEKNSSQRKTKYSKLEALKKEHKNMFFCKSLLDAYENNPILWNTKLPENKSRSKRQLAMEKVLECVSETCRELNIADVNVDYLKKKICVLRTGYKQELRNMIDKGTNETSLWYFDQLTTMIGDINNIEQQTTDQEENLNNLELLDESEKIEMNIDFIEMYKSFPCLWDEKDPDYENKDVRETAREVIIEKMKERWNIDLTPQTLHKKTLYIRALYARETQRRKDKLKSNAAEGTSSFSLSPPTPPPPPPSPYPAYLSELAELYFEKLSFLDYSTAKEYKCEYCPLSFCSEKKYKYHRYTHDGTHPYICGVCGKGFMRPANLQYHENTHLAAEDRPFACDYCCARFSHQVNRDVHMRRHTGQHVHRCNLCDKSFASSTEVKLHARSHTDEKPYICETCGKRFKSNGCFYHHRKKHLQQRDFKCKMCPKSFYRSYLLNAHMKSHLNIRDVICQVCQKAFTTQKSLTQHMKLHDEVKKYACRICNKTYAQASGLNFHMKSH